MFYDNVYNMPDGPPPKEIIDSDDKLDKWIIAYNNKKRAERTGKRGKKSAKDHATVFNYDGD